MVGKMDGDSGVDLVKGPPIDAPFLPDEDYLAVLGGRKERLHSLHFSLYSRHGLDARHRFDLVPLQTLVGYMVRIEGVKKYALLNSRFLAPETYLDPEFLGGLVADLEYLLQEGVLDGIVFSDAYLIQALSDAGPEAASRLEAIPSINMMFDSFDKVRAVMDLISRTHFRLPGKIVLDRSLNRRLENLSQTAGQCRRAFPGLEIGLLANEGCLYQCPFKPAHDAHIAYANQTGGPALTFQANEELGCRRVLGEAPWRLLTSPFIRPEDTRQYIEIIDFIKICGRTLGPDFLAGAFQAYDSGVYRGNLPALLDTVAWMADLVEIPNHFLPPDFFRNVTACDNHCAVCGFCSALYDRLAESTDLRIKDLRT